MKLKALATPNKSSETMQCADVLPLSSHIYQLDTITLLVLMKYFSSKFHHCYQNNFNNNQN